MFDDKQRLRELEYQQKRLDLPTRFVGCKYYSSVNRTATTSTWLPLQFNKVVFNTGIEWNIAEPSKFYVPLPGVYQVVGVTKWVTNGTGARALQIWINGVSKLMISLTTCSASAPERTSIIGTFSLGLRDRIQLAAFQTSGGNLDVEGGAEDSPVISIIRQDYL